MSFSDFVDENRKKNAKKQVDLNEKKGVDPNVVASFWSKLRSKFLSSFFSTKITSHSNQEISDSKEFAKKDDLVSEEKKSALTHTDLRDINGDSKKYLKLEDLEKFSLPEKNLSGKINIELYIYKSYLTLFLYPPKDGIDSINFDASLEKINYLLSEYGLKKEQIELKDYLNKALRTPVVFSLKKQLPNSVRDSVLILTFSENKCQAFLEITKPSSGGTKFTVEEIKLFLTKEKVKYGLIENSIILAVKKEIFDKKILVAQGIEAIHGGDEKLDYKIPIENKGMAKVNEDGTVDFREINFTISVLKDQVLVEKILNTPARNGCDVFGQKIWAKLGQTVQLSAGKNVSFSEDGTKLIALINGNALKSKKDNNISVEDVLVISGDVGPETGNIRCFSSVEVEGSVLDGYELYSDSNILVRGTIGAAKIKSKGNLEVRLGIMGRGKSEVICAGDLFCKFMQDTLVTVSGNLYVEEFIIRCEVDCEKGIYLNSTRRATIIASRVSATHTIFSNTVGSPNEAETRLQVGVNPILQRQYQNEFEKYKEVEKEILEKQSFLKGMEELGIDVVKKKDGLTVSKQFILSEVSALEMNLKNLKETKDFTLEKIKKSTDIHGIIRINNLMHGGTVVVCVNAEEKTQNDMKGPFICELHRTENKVTFKGIRI